MRKLFILVALMLSTMTMEAQEIVTRAEIQTRIDYMQEYIGKDAVGPNSGFKGRYLLFRLDGNITEGLSYSYRQRINKPAVSSSVFDATDWLMVNYSFGPWGLSAGKQVVAIGGYEYDRSPVDLFFCSEYWNNIDCFQFGVSGSYTFSEGNDMLTFQVSESPFRRAAANPLNENMLAYNLMWTSSHDWLKTIYTANAMEYTPGKYIYYLALGNRFEFGRFKCELDLMNRTSDLKGGSMDFSVIGEVAWSPVDALNVFVKASYDYNDDVMADLCVAPGTDIFRAGAGVEYFPLKDNKNLRLHLNCCYTDGKCASTTVLKPHQTIIDAGVTWKLNLLNIKRR